MNLITLLRLIKGYTEFEGKGGFTERFINLSAFRKIHLWDISFIDGSLKAKVKSADYFKLRDVAKRSGVKIRIKEKKGIVFFLNKHEKRLGLLIGAAVYVVILAVLSQFVWTIDVSGNENIPKTDVLSYAESLGLFIGTYKPTFIETKAANSLAKNSGDSISWAAINIKGSRAVIEIREKKQSIIEEVDNTPSNLVADFDGIILNTEVYSGVSAVKEGTGVKKGDLLISGVFENYDGSTSFISTKGKITALHEKKLSMLYHKKTSVVFHSNAKKNRTLFFFGLKIPLSFPSRTKSNTYCYSSFSEYNKKNLPVGIITEISFEEKEQQRDEHKVFLSAIESYSSYCYRLNSNTKILKEKRTIENAEEKIVFNSAYEAIDFMGEKQELMIKDKIN